MDPTGSRQPTAANRRKRPWDDADSHAEAAEVVGLPLAPTSQWIAGHVNPAVALAKRLKTTALTLPDQELVPYANFPSNDPSTPTSHPFANYQPDRAMSAMPTATGSMPSRSVSSLFEQQPLATLYTQPSPEPSAPYPQLPLTAGTTDYRAINQLLYQLHQERLQRLGS